MHGEKITCIRDSYCTFDTVYVFDNHYIDIFSNLKWSVQRYEIFLPYKFFLNKNKNKNIEYDYTYYLAAENFNILKIIFK